MKTIAIRVTEELQEERRYEVVVRRTDLGIRARSGRIVSVWRCPLLASLEEFLSVHSRDKLTTTDEESPSQEDVLHRLVGRFQGTVGPPSDDAVADNFLLRMKEQHPSNACLLYKMASGRTGSISSMLTTEAIALLPCRR